MSVQPELRPVYRAIHKPLEWLGIDRRLCFAMWLLAAIANALVHSWRLTLGVGFLIYGLGWWIKTHDDPRYFTLLLMPPCADRYDPFKDDGPEVQCQP